MDWFLYDKDLFLTTVVILSPPLKKPENKFFWSVHGAQNGNTGQKWVKLLQSLICIHICQSTTLVYLALMETLEHTKFDSTQPQK